MRGYYFVAQWYNGGFLILNHGYDYEEFKTPPDYLELRYRESDDDYVVIATYKP